jgi:hypothetical protein
VSEERLTSEQIRQTCLSARMKSNRVHG